jgi:hypothetical protein
MCDVAHTAIRIWLIRFVRVFVICAQEMTSGRDATFIAWPMVA